MSVRLLAALQGDLSKMMAQELNSARVAVTTGVREATQGLKSELRSQIEGSGLGSRLANTWRGEVYPKGRPSLGSAGLGVQLDGQITDDEHCGVTEFVATKYLGCSNRTHLLALA